MLTFVTDYSDAFNYFDKDRDGQISFENLKDGAHRLGLFIIS